MLWLLIGYMVYQATYSTIVATAEHLFGTDFISYQPHGLRP